MHRGGTGLKMMGWADRSVGRKGDVAAVFSPCFHLLWRNNRHVEGPGFDSGKSRDAIWYGITEKNITWDMQDCITRIM